VIGATNEGGVVAATMSRGAVAKGGVAGLYALVFGVAYIAVALIEVIKGDEPLKIGDGSNINEIILLKSTPHNLIHWVTGAVLLLAFFAGVAKPVARVIGVVFLLVTILGLIAPSFTMHDLLDYPGAGLSVPIAYTLVHALTAAGALYAGFLASD
jgi:hypothetical protein